jgi:hypothetical protein
MQIFITEANPSLPPLFEVALSRRIPSSHLHSQGRPLGKPPRGPCRARVSPLCPTQPEEGDDGGPSIYFRSDDLPSSIPLRPPRHADDWGPPISALGALPRARSRKRATRAGSA